jgi:hypothetical protein
MTDIQHSASSLLMVRPVAFGFNEETSEDNVFQTKLKADESWIQKQALKEFDDLVSLLRSKGIKVNVIEDSRSPHTPDSIFPNNWFSTHTDGRVRLYPLKASNRRAERRPEIIEFLVDTGYKVKHIEDFTAAELSGQYLESTGSMVLDRTRKLCYCSVSERTNPELVVEFCEVFGYQPIFFQCFIDEMPVYHTNVCMSVASHFALVALSSFSRTDEREKVENALKVSGKEIIELSEDQVTQFAGNGLEVMGEDGNLFYILSTRAFSALSEEQIDTIEKYATVLHSNLETIENFGGGSARCMMAEVFLPFQRK